ncbi:MAG TPA: prephenate dehydrogenase/arogenate dehydrogenase family protein [Dissulfurispiraceae bacterium]|nr:prephenate dehydrogenase/arogenate dehydrogenase family protein [Dissulfurispiraceae bacterium]
MGPESRVHFRRAAIIGVGLIGASAALAMRERDICDEIAGFGRREENLRRAKERGIIDDYRTDAASSVEGADLVILATPVGILGKLAAAIRPALKKGAVVTDVGSVKGALVAELEALMPEGVHFIGSHPIAGSDKSGIDEARGNLFSGARCIVTPTPRSDKSAMDMIVSMWEAAGALVECMDAFRHDEIFALVSHMPHIIAYAMVNAVEAADPRCVEYSGGGFRDTTRIAASSPELWRDIAMMNRGNLIRVIASFRENLDKIEKCLEGNDAQGLERELIRAQKLRMSIEKQEASKHTPMP